MRVNYIGWYNYFNFNIVLEKKWFNRPIRVRTKSGQLNKALFNKLYIL